MDELNFPENSIYLYDSEAIISGIKFWGSPRSLTRSPDWAFVLPESHLIYYWDKIPKDVEVLMTHGPPCGIMDLVIRNKNLEKIGIPISEEYCGSQSLKDVVDNLKCLKLHVFGHIHEGAGMLKDKKLIYVNASYWNPPMNEINPVQVIEFDSSAFPGYFT